MGWVTSDSGNCNNHLDLSRMLASRSGRYVWMSQIDLIFKSVNYSGEFYYFIPSEYTGSAPYAEDFDAVTPSGNVTFKVALVVLESTGVQKVVF